MILKMDVKKKIRNLLMIIISLAVVLFMQSRVYAQTATTPLYFGITELMGNDTPAMGYAIGNPTAEDGAKIWNIVQYSTSTSNDPTQVNAFCVKSGVGFSDTRKRAKYDLYFDMKTEREEIAKQNDTLSSIVEGTVPSDNGDVSKYDALLAAIDMLYLPGQSPESQKQDLLDAIINYAKQSDSGYTAYVELMQAYPLTDDDIKAVEQAALWYFTNYDEDNGKYDKTDDKGWLYYTLNSMTYSNLADYIPDGQRPQPGAGQARSYQAEILYNYIIREAKANAHNYSDSSSTSAGAPAVVNTTSLQSEEQDNNYILGPINISENEESSIPYTIDFVVENEGTEINNYTLLDSNKNEVPEGTTIKDLVGQDFYISVPKDSATNISIDITINYSDTKITLWASSTNSAEQPIVLIEKEDESVPTHLTFTPEEQPEQPTFDLALRKYITKVNGSELTGADSRVPNIDESTLQSETTATYKHKKDPVPVATGNVVTYKLTIYNEGEKAGRATKIVDQLPTGLKFNRVVSGNFELESYDEDTNRLALKRIDGNTTNLPAYSQGNLSSETIEIECEVTATPDTSSDKVLTNVAWISEEIDEDGTVITNQPGADRDSEPATTPDVNKDNMENYEGSDNKSDLTDSDYYYKGQQDDDDFEKLVIPPQPGEEEGQFDLKLIKRIVAVNDQNVPERIESVDVSKLNIEETTAEYNLNKDPVPVKKGDIVTYTFRIYNEGTIDGYASEITEDVPEGLEFLWSEKQGEELANDSDLTDAEKEAIEFNQKYLWGNFQYNDAGDKIIQISTDYLSKENETTPGENLIPAFGENDGTKTEADLSYKEVSVKFKVVADNISGNVIRNEAEISDDSDEDGNPVDDRDSKPEEWVKYEDDEDYDNVTLETQSFDLALRKFIIAVSKDEQVNDDEYLKNDDGSYTREPVVDTSKLNTTDENGNMITTAIYNHTKEPVIVQTGDLVVYMLRAYNEGDMDGYAAEIKDHLPPYLEFVDNDFNEQYGWTASEDGRTVTTTYLADELIPGAQTAEDGTITLSYKEVPIMCRVTDEAIPSQNITNIADITKYEDENKNPVIDRDSTEDNVELPDDEDLPGYKDDENGDYIPGQEDDDDFEKVVVKTFDLALRKWVTQAIVIEDGNQTITETGHQPYDDPEQIVKVEIHRKKINSTTVKFRYSIRVTNEGDIAGYATEIKDYVPEGLKFVAEDNPGWTDLGNNVISTNLLADKLLQPGEYADVEVVLTWINGDDNMGVMENTAEISEDYNDYDIPDKDSTPDNQKEGEDDIDDAPVMLSVSTGQVRIYFTLGFIILFTIAGGIILIKKYVL